MHASLHQVHQAERNEAGARLGGEEGPPPGGVLGLEGERSGEEGRVRVQEALQEVSSEVGISLV